MLAKVPLVVGFWLATHAVHAVDVTVTRFDDENPMTLGGTVTLRSAVNQINTDLSVGNDRIILSAGTYSLSYGSSGDDANNGGDFDIIHSAASYGTLTIEGVGAGATIIDGNALDRIFDVRSNSNVILKNMTLRNGRAARVFGNGYGGAIYCYGGSVTVDNCVIENNNALGYGGTNSTYGGYGGGIFFNGSGGNTLTITNSTFRNNVARGGYGGTGSPSATGTAGAAAMGGGVYSENGTLTITNSTLNANSVYGGNGGNGGNGGAGTPGAIIPMPMPMPGGVGGTGGYGGRAFGGGVYSTGVLTITNSTVSGNTVVGGNGASGGAGGVGLPDGSPGYGGNGGPGAGAGVHTSFNFGIANSTIASNTSTGGTGGLGAPGVPTSGAAGSAGASEGGGLWTFSLQVLQTPQSIWLNNEETTIQVGELVRYAESFVANTEGGGNVSGFSEVVSRLAPPASPAKSSIFGDNTANVGADIRGDVVLTNSLLESTADATLATGSAGNVTGVDANLAALASNGGPTATHALQAGSPAINAGANPNSLATDQRGAGFPRVVGVAADIGAFELNLPPLIVSATFTPAAPTTSDTVVFTVVATDPEGGPVTLSFTYGDGATDSTGSHKYAAAGTYQVGITASDAEGNTASKTLTVTVITQSTTDTDTDGFSNAIEDALGTNKNSALSTPFNLPSPVAGVGMKITKLAITLNFKRANRDLIVVNGSLPSGTNIIGKYVIIDVGGVVKAFVLDQLGRSPNYGKDFVFSMTGVKDGTSNGGFTMTLKNNTFAPQLVDEKLTASTKTTTTISVNLIFDGKSYVVAVPVKYSANSALGRTRK